MTDNVSHTHLLAYPMITITIDERVVVVVYLNEVRYYGSIERAAVFIFAYDEIDRR
jgi:hypothetical protein